MKLEIFGVKLPEIKKGDNIGELVCENFDLKDGDVVVVTSKIVSKAEGRFVKISEIRPTK
ncbi:MAG TPA: coenzyme F420-0:L-glutamate ligase, partial [Archaeoglobus sp.]|nr:coenzyme F420-0:L-glutamate ligase [Archaeoglobus sp.]